MFLGILVLISLFLAIINIWILRGLCIKINLIEQFQKINNNQYKIDKEEINRNINDKEINLIVKLAILFEELRNLKNNAVYNNNPKKRKKRKPKTKNKLNESIF
jgi:hypothetical protein